MGTNYYAEWTVSPSQEEPVGLVVQREVIAMHICKSLTMFQGQMFNSWRAWRHFLETNVERVQIRDEYGTELSTSEFIEQVEATDLVDRSRQHRWLVSHGVADAADWKDADGFSFHQGWFC